MGQKSDVAKQAYYFEKEHNDCLSCGEDITHPICPECLSRAFLQWIKKFDKDVVKTEEKIKAFLRYHKLILGKSKTCVSCKKPKTHICPNCFSKYLRELVKEAHLGFNAMAEFLFIFNFDFKENSFQDELETFGGY